MLHFSLKEKNKKNAVVDFLWQRTGQDRKLDYYANYGKQTLNKPMDCRAGGGGSKPFVRMGFSPSAVSELSDSLRWEQAPTVRIKPDRTDALYSIRQIWVVIYDRNGDLTVNHLARPGYQL